MSTYEHSKRTQVVGDNVEQVLSISIETLDSILTGAMEYYGGSDRYMQSYQVNSLLQRVGLKTELLYEVSTPLWTAIEDIISKAGDNSGVASLDPEEKMKALERGNMREILEYGHCCCHGSEAVGEYLQYDLKLSSGGASMEYQEQVWEAVEEALDEYLSSTAPKNVTKDAILHVAELAANSVSSAASKSSS